MNDQNQDYRGMRALLMTRVSTPKQEEGYGHPAQEQACREILVEPLGLNVVCTLRDTYSGLEFLEREVLDQILTMAKHKEFELLIIDVLDRLGRKGLERELWRMQLRATGVRMLTTDPSDHADDDSMIGEMVRILKGYQSEDELNNIRRRTMNGRKAKAEGRQKDGTTGPRKVIGQGERPYGYNFVIDDKGKKINYSLNHGVVHIDQYGEKWTEVRVVTVIFEQAADGVTLMNIAVYLNERGIPSPQATRPKTLKNKRVSNPIWQKSELSRMLHSSDYWGERHELKTRLLPKIVGKKYRPRQRTPETERIIVPVPAIVTKELAEKAHKRLAQNARGARRNNPNPEDTLLRAGLVKCGHCGSSMTVSRDYKKPARTESGYYIHYYCGGVHRIGKCQGCTIAAHTIEDSAWQKVLEIIRDPSEVAQKILSRRTSDPTAERRKNIKKKLADIKQRKITFQAQLAELMMTGKLDADTREFLTAQLQQLIDDERAWTTQLAQDGDIHEKWRMIEKKLDELLSECEKLRHDMSDSNCTPSYKTKRDFIEYLGITVTVWRTGHAPRYKVECNPPDIMTLIASTSS